MLSSGTVEASSQPVNARGTQEIQGAAETLLSTLRSQRGKASVPAVSLTVRCVIVNGAAPYPVPSTGGA